MSPRVIGGTINGGTFVDEIPCPHEVDGGGLRYEPCSGTLDVEITAGGFLVIGAKECSQCHREWGDEARAIIRDDALAAIDNYSGPSDSDLAASADSCYPTSDERHAAAWRMKG